MRSPVINQYLVYCSNCKIVQYKIQFEYQVRNTAPAAPPSLSVTGCELRTMRCCFFLTGYVVVIGRNSILGTGHTANILEQCQYIPRFATLSVTAPKVLSMPQYSANLVLLVLIEPSTRIIKILEYTY